MEVQKIVKLKGEALFRSRIILATLSGKTIRLEDIRSDEENDELGLRDYEVSFLKLIESITNGSVIEINNTGTSVYYRPGIIYGGEVRFDCPLSKSIGYYLEMILSLAPFAKHPFQLTMTGITNDNIDPSVDSIRLVSLMALRKFGIKDHLELKINKRGSRPLGGGEVYFSCPVIKSLAPLRWVEEGKIKRIRGMATCMRVSPQSANRLVEGSRALLNRYIPDILIYTDVHKGSEAGNSPGFALMLMAESTTGALLTSEGTGEAGVTPEELASRVTKQLLAKISTYGCVDPSRQWLYLLFMALSSEDVSSILFSQLTAFT